VRPHVFNEATMQFGEATIFVVATSIK